MGYTFRLNSDRCRVGTDPQGASWIEVVYQLNRKAPSGLRHRLVPALENSLNTHQLRLISLDLFDEFVRVRVPSSTPAELVEVPLQDVLGQVDIDQDDIPSEMARQHLVKFQKESKHS